MSREMFSRDDRDAHSHSNKLPSLHEVLGDVLQQPTSDRRSSVDSRRSVSLAMRPYYYYEPYLIPPPRQRSSFEYDRDYLDVSQHRSSSYSSRGTYPTTASTASYSSSSSRTPHPDLEATEAPAHSFHLFNLVPNQGLVHQRSSTRDDLDPSTPKPRLPPTDPARKYACVECGNRFSKQSTLRNHLLTHTGERRNLLATSLAFACSHTGCGRRFSMACNMQRHMRTHTPASAFEVDEDDGLTQHTSRDTSIRGGSISRENSVSRAGSPQEWPNGGRYGSSSRY